ncbi:B3 domain-containing transcription factor VRN1-like isoform X2 [Citrus sinensis]|uniref:B3 domain-containing transcription factor VRN1-like isoform X2 n=1 Tax=Citrus sinensis TaxID=2711 RepID=UPI0022790A15|nr:B3 domain-containing transcription factor VRN1-like isoform X2 [Citrus sinensis]
MAGGNRRAETSHFFKRIPRKFVKRFGDELSAVATLNVPNGRVWQVGLRKDGRKIWLQDGWDNFAEYHSIAVGYFLVFKYAKNSTFDVLVFDMTACEIDYPYDYEETESEEGDEMETENSVEILSFTKMNTPPVQENQVKPGSKPEKKKIGGIKLETATNSREKKRCPTHGNEHGKLKKAAYHEVETDSSDGDQVFDEHELLASLEEMGIFMSEGHRYLSVEERQSLVTAVRLFKPQNPSFVDILRSKKRYSYMYVPSKFSKKHLIRGTRSIKLQDSDGKEWPAQLTWSSGCGIKGGWPAFSKYKNLKQGHVCVFELIKAKDILLKVSIHASSE